MQKYDIHVCLVSAQAAPNLLPILDSEFKPQRAVFVVSTKNEIKEKADKTLVNKKQIEILNQLFYEIISKKIKKVEK